MPPQSQLHSREELPSRRHRSSVSLALRTMARLVNMWQGYHPAALEDKQMPLIVDENLAVSAILIATDNLHTCIPPPPLSLIIAPSSRALTVLSRAKRLGMCLSRSPIFSRPSSNIATYVSFVVLQCVTPSRGKEASLLVGITLNRCLYDYAPFYDKKKMGEREGATETDRLRAPRWHTFFYISIRQTVFLFSSSLSYTYICMMRSILHPHVLTLRTSRIPFFQIIVVSVTAVIVHDAF